VLAARRVPPVLLAGCAALTVEGYAALVHSGGGLNDLLPAYLAVALLAGLAVGSGQAWRAAAAGVLALAQTALLLSALHPAQVVPTAADRSVGQRLVAGIREIGGTVAVPTDPGLSLLAGQSPVAHQDAAYDVLRATNQAAIASFKRSVSAALTAQRFSAVITDSPGPPLAYRPALEQYYQRCPQPLLEGVQSAVFEPVAGITGRPAFVWVPLGRGSCLAAVRALTGSAATASAGQAGRS
jgi:hypothetical protein